MSRSEREVEQALALKEWYIQPMMAGTEPIDQVGNFSRIEYIHIQMCEKWSTRDNSENWTDDSSWQDYNSPPPWNPKLKDINMRWTQPEKLIEILNMSEYVLNRDLVELPCRDKIVESLEEPLEAWHIAWVKTLCDEAEGYADPDDTDSEADNTEENDEGFEFDEDGAYPMMDSEEEIVRILQRNYGIINEQQEELEQHNHRQELSRKGLGILEKIMEEQKLGEGDYLEMCNIFKELYK